ncbi:hypothetical protein RFI_39944 [Reticulomyxa filosa]|uniref:Uncharacterized protein n=1 Tax=Reticulomyxa filosa TaxID=46433 RepID=X6L802_RETFI|nr:hypothetical protein RFI_39944 [Reticulomyxa filosa]|eukprot:ETN97585.1 hypothetical protein RFI_39944 [Reticulomyxa filosa]
MWNYSIDFNLIYVALQYYCEEDINQTFEILIEFEQWKFRDNNEQKYKTNINTFLERRCCNHNINLFCKFLSEKNKAVNAIKWSTTITANDGLPFVEKSKNHS